MRGMILKCFKLKALLKRVLFVALLTGMVFALCACGDNSKADDSASESSDPEVTTEQKITEAVTENVDTDTNGKDNTTMYHTVNVTKPYKTMFFTNPVITQHFGADPYAMEYDGRVYFYMTADAFEYDNAGNINTNTYSKIRSIYVISTDDMVNFTDHGEINIANAGGAAASWAHNSWAPAACWKEIDGKPKFFLYFADNGGGIGVLTSDSPTGPFTDPLGYALINRSIPNCGNVLWLFDPAVLVDDDGSAYIYFGGGVPEGMAAAPGTGRVAKLGADMISIDGDVVALDVPYLFEDSGIHKFNNKYYYTYSTNFSVDAEGSAKYGFGNGDIAMLESDSPMGPFTYKEMILKNPGVKFHLGGNNHHCVFKFKDQWYITYHARTLEQSMGIEQGYRSTHIDVVNIKEDGSIGQIMQTYDGRTQLKYVNPYVDNTAVNCFLMAGTFASPATDDAKRCGSGDMFLDGLDTGDFIKVAGVDFGTGSPKKLHILAAAPNSDAEIYVYGHGFKGEPVCGVKIPAGQAEQFVEYTAELTGEITGINDIYIVCADGEGVQMKSWRFE